MKRRILCTLCMLFLISNLCFSWQSGNDLVKLWKEYKESSSNTLAIGLFMGYVAGCLDALEISNYIMQEAKYGRGNLGFDIPDNATLGQICSVFGKWLEQNPEKWNLDGQLLIVSALQEAFPKNQ